MKYTEVLRNFFALRKNTKKTREEIKSLQDQKLRKLLLYAYDHSAYYRKSFESAGILRDRIPFLPLSAFPSIDKTILMEHFEELVTAPSLNQEELCLFDADETKKQKLFQDKYHVVHSSGSTGKPGYFVYDGEAWDQMLMAIVRGAFWDMSTAKVLRFLLKGPRIVYIAATDGRYGGAMAVGDGIDGMRARQLFLDVKPPLAEWVRKIQAFRPNMAIGYPSALKILGELTRQGEINVRFTRLVSCGEPLGPALRQYLEQTFHADVVNFYGASESLALGVETGISDGMFLFDDMNVLEAKDGAVYLTSLYNFAQPLIRYRLSDQLTLKAKDGGDGKGGYPFSRAENVLGREEDLMWFEDDRGGREFLHPLAVEGFCMEGLLDYQFVQIDKDSFEAHVQVSDKKAQESVRAGMLSQMKAILREKGLEYVQFYVVFVDEIPPDFQTGKKCLIVRQGPKEEAAV